jgi:4-hydroxybenzoate polyprenyltransferase
VLLYALFFYPLAIAHLGVNDLIDVANDKARGMKTIPILYGMKGTAYWILCFSIVHFVAALAFLTVLGTLALVGFVIGFSLLVIGNYTIMKGKSAASGTKALPMFHLVMLIYAVSIILDYWI